MPVLAESEIFCPEMFGRKSSCDGHDVCCFRAHSRCGENLVTSEHKPSHTMLRQEQYCTTAVQQ